MVSLTLCINIDTFVDSYQFWQFSSVTWCLSVNNQNTCRIGVTDCDVLWFDVCDCNCACYVMVNVIAMFCDVMWPLCDSDLIVIVPDSFVIANVIVMWCDYDVTVIVTDCDVLWCDVMYVIIIVPVMWWWMWLRCDVMWCDHYVIVICLWLCLLVTRQWSWMRLRCDVIFFMWLWFDCAYLFCDRECELYTNMIRYVKLRYDMLCHAMHCSMNFWLNNSHFLT